MAAEFCHLKDSEIEWTDFVDPSAQELEAISKKYDLNPYTLIDSLDPDHLPKYEEHNNTHFIIVRLAKEEEKQDQSIRTLSSKIALFFNDDFIITIHRAEQPLIATIREQFVNSGKISSTTGIAIRIIREALHTYEQPAMQLSDKIDFFESKLFLKKNFPANLIESIYFLKNKAGIYKKILLLSNEVVSSVKVQSDDRPALRDVHDLHTKLVLLYDQVQEDANNLLNIYLSLSARKTNDVMKILTIFSVFFMPLTFIVGVYGMNFKFMPELNYKYGYPIAMLSMIVISVVIFVWFKRKKWL